VAQALNRMAATRQNSGNRGSTGVADEGWTGLEFKLWLFGV
jgi:hypothetical protein